MRISKLLATSEGEFWEALAQQNVFSTSRGNTIKLGQINILSFGGEITVAPDKQLNETRELIPTIFIIPESTFFWVI